MSQEEIDFLYKSEYGYDSEEDVDSDIKLKQIKTKREAAKARKELKSFQEKYQPKQKQQAVNNEEQIKAIQQRWEQQLDSQSVNEIVSGDSFKYQVPQEALGKVKSELKDLNNLPKGFTTEGKLKYVIKIIEITSKEKLVTTTKINKTTSNYPYQILKKTGNIVAQPGDRIRYREYRFVNNELEKETPMDQPLQASLPPRNTVPNPPPGNYEALLLGGIGDSLHLGQLLAGVDRLPKGLKETDTINYRIQIVDVFTPGEFEIDKILQKANSLQLKKETIARKKEVEKITLATIEKFNNGELEDDLNYTHSGLKYILHQKGKGKKVTPLQKVKVQYMGFLSDGKVFDTSFDDGNPIVFPLGAGKVIKGWDEGISKLTVGSSATFFIPYQLAYGIAGWPGKIPNKADLVFYIELISSY